MLHRRPTRLSLGRIEFLQLCCQFAGMVDEPIGRLESVKWKAVEAKPVARGAAKCAGGMGRLPIDH